MPSLILDSLSSSISAEDRRAIESEMQRLEAENKSLSEELARLQQVIRDVRTRDANKRCLCRGQGGG